MKNKTMKCNQARRRTSCLGLLRLRHASDRRRGAAVVEFALIAPIFFLLVFGIIEFGRMVMVQQVITNASREAARLAILEGAVDTSIETDTETILVGQGVPGANVAITTVTSSDPVIGDRKEVAVSVPFDQVSWLNAPMFPFTPGTLTATTSMRVEQTE